MFKSNNVSKLKKHYKPIYCYKYIILFKCYNLVHISFCLYINFVIRPIDRKSILFFINYIILIIFFINLPIYSKTVQTYLLSTIFFWPKWGLRQFIFYSSQYQSAKLFPLGQSHCINLKSYPSKIKIQKCLRWKN